MFCPKCKSEYIEGYTECSDCNTFLVERLPDKETKNKSLVWDSLFRKVKYILLVPLVSLKTNAIIIFIQAVVLALLYLIHKILLAGNVSILKFEGIIIMVFLITNHLILPLCLSIYNIILNIKLNKYSYLSNLLLILLTIITTTVFFAIFLTLIDKRIINGYDKRQEFTGGMALLYGLHFSLAVTLIIGFVNQIILALIYFSKRN